MTFVIALSAPPLMFAIIHILFIAEMCRKYKTGPCDIYGNVLGFGFRRKSKFYPPPFGIKKIRVSAERKTQP